MYFNDLRTPEDVDALDLDEFNLRVRCVLDRLDLESDRVDAISPSEIYSEAGPMLQEPVQNVSLLEALMDIHARQWAEK